MQDRWFPGIPVTSIRGRPIRRRGRSPGYNHEPPGDTEVFTTTNTRWLTAGLAMIVAGLAFTPTVGAATVRGVRCDLTARRVVCARPADGVTVTLDTRVVDAARPVAVTGRPGTLADFEGVPVRVG